MTAKLTASADGSKVLIGTAAEDALEIDATAKTIKALSPYTLVPSPQTWQNMTAFRNFGTNYTNDTDAPIEVALTVGSLGSVSAVGIYCANIQIAQMYAKINEHVASFSFTVPVGATYSVQGILGSSSNEIWSELR
jgi:hypothetical protein